MTSNQKLTAEAVIAKLREAIEKRTRKEGDREAARTSWHLREELKPEEFGDRDRDLRDQIMKSYVDDVKRLKEAEEQWWGALLELIRTA